MKLDNSCLACIDLWRRWKWFCENFLIDHWHVELNWDYDQWHSCLICGQGKFEQSKILGADNDEMWDHILGIFEVLYIKFFKKWQCLFGLHRQHILTQKLKKISKMFFVLPASQRNCFVHNFFIKSLLKMGSWKDNGKSQIWAVMCEIRKAWEQKVGNKILFQSFPHNGVTWRHFKSILLLISARPLNPSIWDNVSVSE